MARHGISTIAKNAITFEPSVGSTKFNFIGPIKITARLFDINNPANHFFKLLARLASQFGYQPSITVYVTKICIQSPIHFLPKMDTSAKRPNCSVWPFGRANRVYRIRMQLRIHVYIWPRKGLQETYAVTRPPTGYPK